MLRPTGRVAPRGLTRALTRALVGALVAGLALAGCSGRSGEAPSADRTTSAAADATGSGDAGGSSGSGGSGGSGGGASPSPSTHVKVPDGVTLTDPGTELSFRETARVAYEVTRTVPATTSRSDKNGKKHKGGKQDKGGKKDKPAGPRKTTVGTVLGLTVDSASKGRLDDLSGFNLTSDYERKASYYYVRVSVKNLGTRRFGDVEVPLYGISGDNRLLPAVRFNSAFAKCPTESLPPGFAPGARLQTCLVFLSPDKGSLVGVSYRPTADSTSIEWHGKVAQPAAKAGGKPGGKASGKPGGKAGDKAGDKKPAKG